MFTYSHHLLERATQRNISVEAIEDTLQNPDAVVVEDDLAVYQKTIYESDKAYLLRIFVNEQRQPPLVVTAYKTSNLSKYLQP